MPLSLIAINEPIRKELRITRDEWAFCEYIMNGLTSDHELGFCLCGESHIMFPSVAREYIARAKQAMLIMGLIEEFPVLKTTQKWFNASRLNEIEP